MSWWHPFPGPLTLRHLLWLDQGMWGFIANTDGDWFELHKERQDRGDAPEEVNFWRPSERVVRVLP